MGFNQAAWFAGGVVIPNTQKTELYVFWYEREGRRYIKVPGGSQKCENGRNDRTPAETVIAELVGDHELLEAGSLTITENIWKNEVSPIHFQEFFLCELGADARIRTVVKVDEERGMLPETLDVPFLIDVGEFYNHKHVAYRHRQMIPHLMAFMAAKHEAWGWKARQMGLV